MTKPSRSIAVVTAAVIGALLAGCGNDSPTAQATPTPNSVPTTAATTSPPPLPDQDKDGTPDASDAYPSDPSLQADRIVFLSCGSTYEIKVDPSRGPDFSEVWKAKADMCDADRVLPVTNLEKQALKTSEYEDEDISTLYTICGENDPADTYAQPGFAASSAQIPERKGALTLCPNHPLAAKWKQAIERGKGDADLEKQGRLFYDGTFLVGKDIKAGTYVVTDVEDCYWERQNKNGDTIDNDFVISARRVQVTIRASDYAFHAEGCGEWRPAS